jgi:hypothetical protein
VELEPAAGPAPGQGCAVSQGGAASQLCAGAAGVMPTWKDFNLLLDARLARRRSEIAASLQAQSVETRAGWVVQALGRAVVGTVL